MYARCLPGVNASKAVFKAGISSIIRVIVDTPKQSELISAYSSGGVKNVMSNDVRQPDASRITDLDLVAVFEFCLDHLLAVDGERRPGLIDLTLVLIAVANEDEVFQGYGRMVDANVVFAVSPDGDSPAFQAPACRKAARQGSEVVPWTP
jgi:hypothetical protein